MLKILRKIIKAFLPFMRMTALTIGFGIVMLISTYAFIVAGKYVGYYTYMVFDHASLRMGKALAYIATTLDDGTAYVMYQTPTLYPKAQKIAVSYHKDTYTDKRDVTPTEQLQHEDAYLQYQQSNAKKILHMNLKQK